MLARWIGTGIIAALLAPATVASAQTDVPDLKGSWSGTAEIVHRSEVAEHIDPTAKPSFPTLPFTITIEQQEGHGFAGSLASARASDPLIGMIRSDGRRLHRRDARSAGCCCGCALGDRDVLTDQGTIPLDAGETCF